MRRLPEAAIWCGRLWWWGVWSLLAVNMCVGICLGECVIELWQVSMSVRVAWVVGVGV